MTANATPALPLGATVAVWALICAVVWATLALAVALAGLVVGLTPALTLGIVACATLAAACFIAAAYLIP